MQQFIHPRSHITQCKGPFRIGFLFLILLSALTGLFTLAGIRARELDVTRESLVLGFVMESGIIGKLSYTERLEIAADASQK